MENLDTKERIKLLHQFHSRMCYLSNNRFAYQFDRYGKGHDDEIKVYNFVPTYDKWCLYCDKKECNLRCSNCKTIYFCNKECQSSAWKIHKKHCNRNQFILCIQCGNPDIKIKCDKCPVMYCSDKCKSEMHQLHLDFDCVFFSKLYS